VRKGLPDERNTGDHRDPGFTDRNLWQIEEILDPAAAGSEEKCEETMQAGGNAAQKRGRLPVLRGRKGEDWDCKVRDAAPLDRAKRAGRAK